MKLPTNELLLALRSPTSGWLATMICALEEAVRDPDFSEHHRAMLTQLLAAESIPAPIAAAAEERLCRFEQSVSDTQHELLAAIAPPSQPVRPKLTLVVSAA